MKPCSSSCFAQTHGDTAHINGMIQNIFASKTDVLELHLFHISISMAKCKCGNPTANALELQQFCTNQSISCWQILHPISNLQWSSRSLVVHPPSRGPRWRMQTWQYGCHCPGPPPCWGLTPEGTQCYSHPGQALGKTKMSSVNSLI